MIPTFRRAIFPPNSWSGTIPRRNDIKGVCLILDRDLLRVDAVRAMRMAQSAGIRFFQYRNKAGTRREIYNICLDLSLRARETDSLFIVNDHADIAVAVGAAGVHLGQDDLPIEAARKVVGPERIIGISTHSREQAIAAEKGGADYIGFGPVFPTTTKVAGRVQGVETVLTIRDSVSIPIVAIGGITRLNVREVLAAGADAVAIISAVLSAPDMEQAAAEMLNLMKNGYILEEGER